MLEIISAIKPVDVSVRCKAQERMDNVAKPIGSLGKLERIYSDMAAAQKCATPDISKRLLLEYFSDNGVLAQNVSQAGHEVTTLLAHSAMRNGTTVAVMAQQAHVDVRIFDVGMVDDVCGMEKSKTMNGTNDFTQGPAMSRQDCITAIEFGIAQAMRAAEEGYTLLATGETGIGNTTTTAAVVCALCSLEPKDVVGMGSGLSSEGIMNKADVVRKGISVNAPDKNDPIDVISKLGGFDIAAMCGTYLGAAASGIPVVMDGVISTVAALCAVKLCPDVSGYLVASHLSAEPSAQVIIDQLDVAPLIDAGMRLGEGTGAIAGIALIDMAFAVIAHTETFEQMSILTYDPRLVSKEIG